MSELPSYYQTSRPEILKLIPDNYAKVLEVGCADGNFYQYFSRPCEYWGIEPFQAAAQIASSKLYKVLTGTFYEVFDLLPDDYFDLVICNDVIEHMADHDAFFQAIKRKITKESYIIGSIPNVRYISNLIELLLNKDWMYKEGGILDRTHLRFFTEKSLRRSLIENNYIVEELCGINKYEPIMEQISLKTYLKKMLIPFFGRDSQFLQFGFRIKCQ